MTRARSPSVPVPFAAPTTIALFRTSAPCTEPPFGLRSFAEDSDVVALRLTVPPHWPSLGMGDLNDILDQVPSAKDLRPGTRFVLLQHARRPRPSLFAFLGDKKAVVARAVRTSALLARGFSDVGAGVDSHGNDLAWGVAL